jgi:3-deoxy-D-manno-octulosonic acid kinase
MLDGEHIATRMGAMLADRGSLGNLLEAGEALFEPEFWAANGAIGAASSGRGSAWFIESDAGHWVLRHYRRGGFAAQLADDRYLYLGEARVRSFAEFRLLARLSERGLPVPKPLAARYVRRGPTYRCDLIMQRIPNARPLSNHLETTTLSEAAWRAVGATIGRFHRDAVDHADLNAHNILIDAAGSVSLIDFDRGRLRPSNERADAARPAWAHRNIARLRRSLEKISASLPSERFSAAAWAAVLAGYASANVPGSR